MRTFKEYLHLNEDEANFDSGDFDDMIIRNLKSSGYKMTYTTMAGYHAEANTLEIEIDNDRPDNKRDNFDQSKALYFYNINVEVNGNRYSVQIQKNWYEGMKIRQTETKKVLSSEKDALRFIVDYFKNEIKLGCFDKGKFTYRLDRG